MKLVLIALDGFDADLFSLSEFGTLKDLFKSNSASTLASTVPYITPTAFASMQTGKGLGMHGISGFVKQDNPFLRRFEPRLYGGNDLRQVTFYEVLHRYNKRCFICGLPFSYPPRIPGDIIFDWFSGKSDPASIVHPCSLLDQYTSLRKLTLFPPRSPILTEWIRNIGKATNSIIDVIFDVLRSHLYDFYFFYINATDQIAHSILPEIMAGDSSRTVSLAKETFQAIDKMVSTIKAELPGDHSMIIMSDHGHRVYDYLLNINDWLEENGYLKYGSGEEIAEERTALANKNSDYTIHRRPIRVPRWVAKTVSHNRTLMRLVKPARWWLEEKLKRGIVAQPGIDYTKSLAASMGGDGSIYLNPSLPSDEAQKLKEEITSKISSIGKIYAYDTTKLYSGPMVERLPEIYLSSDRYRFSGSGSGSIEQFREPYHRRDGIVILMGEAFEREPNNPNITDIAPTILHLLGVPIPSDTQGRVLSESYRIGSDPDTRKSVFLEIETTERQRIKNQLRKINKI